MKRKFCVVFDYYYNNGGASHVANEEVKSLLIFGYDAKCVALRHSRRCFQFFEAFSCNIQILLFFIFTSRCFVVHTFSFFPIILFLATISPKRFLFVVHDYLAICPSKAMYNFRKQDICGIQGASLPCFKENCGYSSNKKFFHSAYTVWFKVFAKFRGFKFRALSSKSAQLFENDLGLNVSVLPNLYVWRSGWTEEMASNFGSIHPYIVFAGRASLDKGYDRFENLVSHKYHKVHVGASGMDTDKDTYLGWMHQSGVEYVVSKASAIIYPARQIDCDPLILQLALKYRIPFFVDVKNASADTVSKYLGKQFVVSDWDNFLIDSINLSLNENFSYRQVDADAVVSFYSNAFS